MTQWKLEPAEPAEVDGVALCDEPCFDGPAGHEWRLTVEEGQVSLWSGCDACDRAVTGDGLDLTYMAGTIVGRLVFEPDHPNLGGWHFDQRCDCGWQWRFEAKSIESEAS